LCSFAARAMEGNNALAKFICKFFIVHVTSFNPDTVWPSSAITCHDCVIQYVYVRMA
jgi:hypothetical protein